MRHDWILEVLADVESYARQNDLPGLARKVEEAMAELRREAESMDDRSATPLTGRRRVN
jgi:hypothetical protein